VRVREPTDTERLLAALSRELAGAGLPFMMIGGQAVLLHGVPRLTGDVDVTLAAEPDRLPALLGVCATLGLVPLPAHARLILARDP